MTALAEWLRQIILIVILAALADLLLPSQALQRYVRTVLGLAVMAAMLQPFLPFFQRDWAGRTADAIARELTGFSGAAATGARSAPGFPGTSGTSGAAPVDRDRLQALLRQQQGEQADRLLEQTLAQGIETAFSCRTAAVSVSGRPDDLASLRVQVRLSPDAGGREAEVAGWVARQLGLQASQVDVRVDGGAG